MITELFHIIIHFYENLKKNTNINVFIMSYFYLQNQISNVVIQIIYTVYVREHMSLTGSHLVSEGQVGEHRQVLGPLHWHEEQPRRGLVHILGAGRVQSHVVLRGRPLRLVAGHVDVLVNWNRKHQVRIEGAGWDEPTLV